MKTIFFAILLWVAAVPQLLADDCGCGFGGACKCGPRCKCDGLRKAPPILIDDRPSAPPITIDDRPAKWLSYHEGCQKAIKEGKPLVTFLAHPAYAVEGAVVCYTDSLTGYSGKQTIVSVPSNGQLWWKATLPLGTGDERIKAAFAPDPFRHFVQAPLGWDCGPGG
jgi:hypothetical protein